MHEIYKNKEITENICSKKNALPIFLPSVFTAIYKKTGDTSMSPIFKAVKARVQAAAYRLRLLGAKLL